MHNLVWLHPSFDLTDVSLESMFSVIKEWCRVYQSSVQNIIMIVKRMKKERNDDKEEW